MRMWERRGQGDEVCRRMVPVLNLRFVTSGSEVFFEIELEKPVGLPSKFVKGYMKLLVFLTG